MSEHFKLMVPGAAPSPTPLEIHAPWDNALIATADTADGAAVEQALASAYALYRDRDSWLSPAERIRILQKTADLMQAQRETLAVEAAREGGKPLVDSLVEVDRAIDGMHGCICLLYTSDAADD